MELNVRHACKSNHGCYHICPLPDPACCCSPHASFPCCRCHMCSHVLHMLCCVDVCTDFPASLKRPSIFNRVSRSLSCLLSTSMPAPQTVLHLSAVQHRHQSMRGVSDIARPASQATVTAGPTVGAYQAQVSTGVKPAASSEHAMGARVAQHHSIDHPAPSAVNKP